MYRDFSTEYSELSDDELLHLASERSSLTDEAVAALDVELRHRHLTQSDQTKYQRHVNRLEHREFRTRRRKIFGKSRISPWEILSYFAAVGLIFLVYFQLPTRYRLTPDWQDPAVCTMLASVAIIGWWRELWRDVGYWTALILSSAAQLIIVHAFTQRVGELSRGAGKGATLLGFILFIAAYGGIRLLRRKFDSEASSTSG